jgi:pimeloyl-ACP methyl ester carboxylesterase
MSVAYLPGFLATPGDEAALIDAGLAVDVVPLTRLARAVDDVDRDLVPALAAHIDDGAVVVGYSMGARVLLAALSRGLRVRAAVLLSLSSTPPAARAARAALDDERARALVSDPASFVDDWATLPLFRDAGAHPAWRAQHARRRTLHADEVTAHARTLQRFSSAVLVNGALDIVDVPVTLVAGARDAAAVDVAKTLATALARARVEVVDDSGHVLPLEAPAAVARIVSAVDGATAPSASNVPPRRADAAPART